MITRRSQVQILAPPPQERPVNKGLFYLQECQPWRSSRACYPYRYPYPGDMWWYLVERMDERGLLSEASGMLDQGPCVECAWPRIGLNPHRLILVGIGLYWAYAGTK